MQLRVLPLLQQHCHKASAICTLFPHRLKCHSAGVSTVTGAAQQSELIQLMAQASVMVPDDMLTFYTSFSTPSAQMAYRPTSCVGMSIMMIFGSGSRSSIALIVWH